MTCEKLAVPKGKFSSYFSSKISEVLGLSWSGVLGKLFSFVQKFCLSSLDLKQRRQVQEAGPRRLLWFSSGTHPQPRIPLTIFTPVWSHFWLSGVAMLPVPTPHHTSSLYNQCFYKYLISLPGHELSGLLGHWFDPSGIFPTTQMNFIK